MVNEQLLDKRFLHYLVEYITDELSNTIIPEYMHEGILNFVGKGHRGGSFLDAVLRGDKERALLSADPNNKPIVDVYIKFFKEVCPQYMCGSDAAVEQWLKCFIND
jgi:hypothetical protein